MATEPLEHENVDVVMDSLRKRVQAAARPHGGKRDLLLHNGSTMAAMAATTTATVLPVAYSTWARAAAGVATFMIAVGRALDFGSRWRWHLNMRARYAVLLDRIDQVGLLPYEERAKALSAIYDDLAKVRALERTIPGSGNASGPAAPGGS